ncbi:NAD(P)H-binding protein [Herbidospora sp. RD11066]
MYAITGVTGHVGGAAARELLRRGAPVRAVVRDPAKGDGWPEVAVADLGDPEALAAAFRGCAGAFVLLPTDMAAADPDAAHRATADAIADAVRESGVPHVVVLSSIGADLADGTGPIRWLHHLENALRATGTRVTALRATHFQEKAELLLGAVQAGVYPVFAESADVPTPMVATRDIGDTVADLLLAPGGASETVDLDGPSYTERQVAEELSAILGRPLQVVTIPQPGWAAAMVDGGLPPQIAAELVGLYDAEQRDILRHVGDRLLTGRTELAETLGHLAKSL